jgi:Protein of unknown function (DUF1553)/Protein of unknown function (DUF1549)/Concanavalin A-like lectin/glucanases superfamily/Planctomycete cytochrome C
VLVRSALILLFCASALNAAETGLPDKIDYGRHIRPILSNACFSCHGPDAESRKAGLRFDVREIAIAALESGSVAIVPGKGDQSELVERINSTDPDVVMPPPGSNKDLSERDKQLLRRWIDEGAEYHKHWSLVTPKAQPLPSVKQTDWPRNGIDHFVLARLENEGLAPAAEAERAVLLRRLTLDLTGLPPTPAEIEAFLSDTSSDAYEKVVDRLLTSPRYAERMAMSWLDLARYADTHGYNNDGERIQWAWRDWVINAFNTNMPYDQFITEQLAGDLLEGATPQQKLATAFSRNHVITSEGGIIDEEYRVEYVADRVHTTATVFLGLSMQCARCHDHKFDPLTQREYYGFFSFFNNVPEGALQYNQNPAALPVVEAASPLDAVLRERLSREIARLDERRQAHESRIAEPLARWEESARTAGLPEPAIKPTASFPLDEGEGAVIRDSVNAGRTAAIVGTARWSEGRGGTMQHGTAQSAAGGWGKALEFDGQTYVELGDAVALEHDKPFTISAWIFPLSLEPGTVVSKMDQIDAFHGFDLIIEQGRPAMHLIHHWPDDGLKVIAAPMTLGAWHHVVVSYDGSSKAAGFTFYIDGAPAPVEIVNDKLQNSIATTKPLCIGRRTTSEPFLGRIADLDFYSTALKADGIKQLAAQQALADVHKILALPAADRLAGQQQLVRQYYLASVDTEHQAIAADLDREKKKLAAPPPATMVMEEMSPPRQAFLLKRGAYDQPGEPVTPHVPAVLPPLPDGAPANRLGLARWLVDPGHPLTARVAVNRQWQIYFGNGIVETVEDFGSQGSWPTHPELLDWLALQFVGSGWDFRGLQKLIVTSATYRQSSRADAGAHERDPKNLLLARGARFRLPAEMVRDNALAISGLLVDEIGGPSVYPYQPDGLWQDISVEHQAVYRRETGANLYRRSMYTFWKRTCPPPGLATFDAPDRETCLIRRARTNTPLQALVLMNDPTYVEAARKLAERVLTAGGDTPETRLDYAFRLATARPARAVDTDALKPLLSQATERFRAAPEQAQNLLRAGASEVNGSLDPAELAAWTVVGSVILALDETITKE